jgi:ribosomal protein L40E
MNTKNSNCSFSTAEGVRNNVGYMKTCAHCGCLHTNRASKCRGCGTQFPAVDPIAQAHSDNLLRKRIRFLVIAWGITAVMMTVGAPSSWQFFRLFPMYSPITLLLAFVFRPDSEDGMYFLIGLGWFYYAILTIWFLCSHRPWVYVILCLSLLVNIGGCQAVMHGVGVKM